jgi:hypothetical protein
MTAFGEAENQLLPRCYELAEGESLRGTFMGFEYHDLQSGSAAGFWIRFVLAVLATWRVSHLLASEDGPWEFLARLRQRLGHSILGQLMDCFGCISIWVAAPLSLFVVRRLPEGFMCWLALSGAAFLLERMQPEPVVIERMLDPGKETSSWDAAVEREQI